MRHQPYLKVICLLLCIVILFTGCTSSEIPVGSSTGQENIPDKEQDATILTRIDQLFAQAKLLGGLLSNQYAQLPIPESMLVQKDGQWYCKAHRLITWKTFDEIKNYVYNTFTPAVADRYISSLSQLFCEIDNALYFNVAYEGTAKTQSLDSSLVTIESISENNVQFLLGAAANFTLVRNEAQQWVLDESYLLEFARGCYFGENPLDWASPQPLFRANYQPCPLPASPTLDATQNEGLKDRVLAYLNIQFERYNYLRKIAACDYSGLLVDPALVTFKDENPYHRLFFTPFDSFAEIDALQASIFTKQAIKNEMVDLNRFIFIEQDGKLYYSLGTGSSSGYTWDLDALTLKFVGEDQIVAQISRQFMDQPPELIEIKLVHRGQNIWLLDQAISPNTNDDLNATYSVSQIASLFETYGKPYVNLWACDDWTSPEEISIYSYYNWYRSHMNQQYPDLKQKYEMGVCIEHNGDGFAYPAEQMESYIQQYFNVSTEYLRSNKEVYFEEGNYYCVGGGSPMQIHLYIEKASDITITGNRMEFIITQEELAGDIMPVKRLTVQRNPDQTFRYISCVTVG